MRKIGKVKYNGKSTADLGVIVSGEASFDAAAPDYTSYQIPGKNGDLMLSNNRFLNIDVTYPAFIPADFEERVQAIRNWMRSARSYARIEDNYDLLHFRLGMGKDVLTFEPSAENEGSNMSLVFDCKPQRFLYSGEEGKNIGVWGPTQTDSGEMVSFEDKGDGAFKSLTATITPSQDFHGYEHPWPRNGGKNRIVNNLTESWVLAGLTMTSNTDGSITVEIPDDITTYKMVVANTAIYNGGTAANQNTEEKILKNGTYKIVFAGDAPNYFSIQVYGANSSGISDITQIVFASSGTFTVDDSFAYNWVRIITKASVPAGTYTIYPMILDVSETDLTWEPQQNICPINGWTGSIVNVQGKNFFVNRVTQKVTGGYSEVTPKDDGSYAVKITSASSSTIICLFNTAMANGGTLSTQNYGKKTIPNGQYNVFFSGDVPPQFRVQVFGSNNPSGTDGAVVLFNKNSGSLTIDDSFAYNWIRIAGYGGLPAGNYILKPAILRQDEPDLMWTKYVGGSYPVSWQAEAGTVYGGTVDVVSGTLTVDRVYKSLATMNWKLYSSAEKPVFYADNAEGRIYELNEESGILCDTYQTNPYATTAISFVRTGLSPALCQAIEYAGRLMIVDERFDTLVDFKAAVTGNVVIKLATPQTYQLTGQQINTILGQNNVWADVGTIAAEWGKNPNGLYNPTLFDALPLIEVKNPQNGCALTVNGTTMTCTRRNTGTVTIDCELMDVYSGATNLNSDWSKDFPKLSPGENPVTFSGADAVTIMPRWWEL